MSRISILVTDKSADAIKHIQTAQPLVSVATIARMAFEVGLSMLRKAAADPVALAALGRADSLSSDLNPAARLEVATVNGDMATIDFPDSMPSIEIGPSRITLADGVRAIERAAKVAAEGIENDEEQPISSDNECPVAGNPFTGV
jgi:hypothetical protein